MASLASQARQWIIEVEMQTASIFRADETYSTRKSELTQYITDQIKNGLYATEVVQVPQETNELDEDGNPVVIKVDRVKIKRDGDGNAIIIKKGIFLEYQLELVNHSIKSIKYDATIEKLISQKKQAEQAKAVAITNAEKALQDEITTEAQGRARIAQAKADEEVSKITAVTQAEKEKAVAVLNAQRERQVAGENAEKAKLEALATVRAAQAKQKELRLADGLSAAEKYKIDKNTEARIKSAEHYSKWVGPEIVINGGGGSGNGGGIEQALMVGMYQDMIGKSSSK